MDFAGKLLLCLLLSDEDIPENAGFLGDSRCAWKGDKHPPRGEGTGQNPFQREGSDSTRNSWAGVAKITLPYS